MLDHAPNGAQSGLHARETVGLVGSAAKAQGANQCPRTQPVEFLHTWHLWSRPRLQHFRDRVLGGFSLGLARLAVRREIAGSQSFGLGLGAIIGQGREQAEGLSNDHMPLSQG